MTSYDRLRLAVVLAHPVEGASVELECWDGQRLVVSAHPAADLTVCQLRQVVLASARPDQPDWTRIVAAVSVGGALVDLGAGVYRRRERGLEQRWFVADLVPDGVAAVLREIDPGHHAVEARVVADLDLGAAAVCIQTTDRSASGSLDRVALDAATACLVAELVDRPASAPH
ncbi:MAG: hypothetical protein MUE78_03855 [Ilumatobacteraceae bacterium]|jgi:hypothetical protein|nr:hypothetical protein [Ilumatobacteraceae bacterium]